MGVIKDLKSKLIVSCQPVVGGALDNENSILNIAEAAVDGGAAALLSLIHISEPTRPY